MSTQAISAVETSVNNTYDMSAGKISELTKLEQNIKKMKSEYENYSKYHGQSSPDINAKIKELDNLISKVQRQIEQIKRDQKKAGGSSSKTAAASASTYKYLGSAVSIYKKAFSLAHRACAEVCAALSDSLHAPYTESSCNSQNDSLENSENIADALRKINTAQTETPEAAISAAFSEGIDVTA